MCLCWRRASELDKERYWDCPRRRGCLLLDGRWLWVMAQGRRAAGIPSILEPWTARPPERQSEIRYQSWGSGRGGRSPAPARPISSGGSGGAPGRVGGRACRDCPELGLPPPLAPAAQQAERRRRGAVQPERAGSRPSAYLCAAVLASRMPAPCIQERTEPKPAGSSGSSFRFSPPRGRVSCAGNIGARSRWAPPPPGMRSSRGCGRLGSARPDGSGRLQERSAAPGPRVSVRARLSGAPSEKAGPRAPALSPPLPGRGAGRWRDSPAA